ncbi:MAG: proline dehydrogenase family protein [Gammaproteobacteria bacterium]
MTSNVVEHAAPEERIQALGTALLERAGQGHGGHQGWLDALIARSIQDEDFRVQVLRFIDVLPALRDDTELVHHLQEYFSTVDLPWPGVSRWSLRHSGSPWAVHVAAPLVRTTLRGLSRRFMGGHTVRQALETARGLHARGMQYTLDLLGEAVTGETEAGRYQQAYLDLLQGLAAADSQWDVDTPGNTLPEHAPRHHVSIKLSSLYAQINPVDPDGSVSAIAARLRPILKAARATHAFVTIDMEQYDFRHIVLQCFQLVLNEPEFRDWPDVGIAIQTYLKDSRADLTQLIEWAKRRGTPVTVRLVRGAYWDYETVIARQHAWPVPVWEHKAGTDACFESCLALLMASWPTVATAVATHNVRSIACALALAEQHGLSSGQYEFQMLYGMADEFKQALVETGCRLRIYVPFGETLPGMSYLVRRLLENSSGQSLLETGILKTVAGPASLEKPVPPTEQLPVSGHRHFRNTPVHRFVAAAERHAFADALQRVGGQLGQEYPLVIGGAPVVATRRISSLNPARPNEVVGYVSAATQAHADQALAAAQAALAEWSDLPAAARADLLRRAAVLLAGQRDEFAAWQVLESGKHWCEADADVCEAIDFLNYYADQAERLAQPQVVEINGEDNRVQYRPRGVGLVITPWNFPLAILTGMLSATIVCGNTAILKPSPLAPVSAARFMQLLESAGLPPGVVNFLPGPGREVGGYLAEQPGIHIIAFTGSQAVGTWLIETGARVVPGQTHVKRVIAEMGGKNAIIIDADADLDDAVPGVVRSAFGYQGQKCSAAARVIVVGDLHDAFVERLVDATRSLHIGDPRQPGNLMGPVIDAAAQERIKALIEQGSGRAQRVLYEPERVPADGYYVAPAIFTGVAPNDPLAQEEIFGPVLTVMQAADFEQALTIANSTRYALTGGVYSRRPSHLQRAREAFQVGNLYLNRKITGAIVARQPFGGFKLSGIGSKAGGRDYLLQFMDPVCVTENTMRRGFAPDVDSEES